MEQAALKGKLVITAKLQVKTGMHIGASNDFAPIGAVDSIFVRDPFTKQPVIPGSSQKGKLRTLLAKARATSYVLNKIEDDDGVIKRLFGTASSSGAASDTKPARLQFYDIFMTKESIAKYQNMDTDTYLGEIKYENTINRTNATANPRQIERVPAGCEFGFKLVYNVEKPADLQEDMRVLSEALGLLQLDYLGGHGSRGYGRVGFSDFNVELFTLGCAKEELPLDTAAVAGQLEESCKL